MISGISLVFLANLVQKGLPQGDRIDIRIAKNLISNFTTKIGPVIQFFVLYKILPIFKANEM